MNAVVLDLYTNAIVADVQSAFLHVTREDAVSWSESIAIDYRVKEEDRIAARLSDRDTHWTQLLDNKSFRVGIGGFSFLDPGGFRYYLPAAMLREIKSDDFGLSFWLIHRDDYDLIRWSALTDGQCRCVARFLMLMTMLHNGQYSEALNSYWNRYLKADRYLNS